MNEKVNGLCGCRTWVEGYRDHMCVGRGWRGDDYTGMGHKWGIWIILGWRGMENMGVGHEWRIGGV